MGFGGGPHFWGLRGSFWGFYVENRPQIGLRDPNVWGFQGGILVLGVFGGFYEENPPQMGLRDPNMWGFRGGIPVLGVFGGFHEENRPQMGLRDPNVWGFGGGPHFLGCLGVFMRRTAPLSPFRAAPLPPQREDQGGARGRGGTSVRRDVTAA